MLEIKNLSKSFHKNKVLDHINLKIEKGDVVGIIGPSGTGKSTLLRCINQLEIPEEGEAVFGGKTVDLSKKHKDSLEFRKSTGMVFQRFYLFEKKTALENVMEGLMVVQKKSKADAKAIFAHDFLSKKEMKAYCENAGVKKIILLDPMYYGDPKDSSSVSQLPEHLP